MAGLSLKVTTAGRAALVNATNTGTLPVTIAQVGVTATGFTPAANGSNTTLPGELKRLATFSGAAVADDTLHLTIRDDSTDAYSLKGFALYLADGTLFALYGQAAEIMGKSAQATLLLSTDTVFADIAATSITLGNTDFWNPPATETVQGVVELATPAETNTGTDGTRAATPKGVKYALDQRLGAAAPSNFIKSLLALTTAAALRTALAIKSAALKDEGAGGTLDADLLDGQHGAYYRAWSNLTGKPTTIDGYGLTDAQRLSPVLTALSAVTPAAGRLPYFNAANTMALATLTAAGRALLDDADAAAQRVTLGLGTAATQDSNAFSANGHKHSAADVTSGTFSGARMPGYTGDVTSAAGGTVNTLVATGVIAGGYGASANATVAFGGSIAVPRLTVDAKGRVTAAATYTLTLPAAPSSVSGNAGTATRLATARTLTIGSSGKLFNGTANVSWTLAEIGAAEVGHKHSATDITSGVLADARIPSLPIGKVANLQAALDELLPSSEMAFRGITVANPREDANDLRYVDVAIPGVVAGSLGSGSLNGPGVNNYHLLSVSSNGYSYSQIGLRFGQASTKPEAWIRHGNSNGDGEWARLWDSISFDPADFAAVNHQHAAADIISGTLAGARMPAYTGDVTSAAGGTVNTLVATGVTAGGYGASANATVAFGGSIAVPRLTVDAKGRVTAASTYTLTLPAAPSSVTGNAGTATRLTTARTLTIGSSGKPFNGTANVSWTLAEIGAAAAGHTHSTSDITSGVFSTARIPHIDGNLETGYARLNATPSAEIGGSLRITTGGANLHYYCDGVLAWTVSKYGNMTVKGDATIEGGLKVLGSVPTWNQDTTGSAATLATARTINGTSFNGSANITTARWGTARTLTIGGTGKSVNGSANVAWTLAEIGAAGMGANTFTGVQTATGFAVSSSRSLKRDICALDIPPDTIDLFQPVTFRYKAAPEKEVAGLIREDVTEIFPLAVTEEGIDYGQLVPLLIATLQHDRAQLRELTARLQVLETRG